MHLLSKQDRKVLRTMGWVLAALTLVIASLSVAAGLFS